MLALIATLAIQALVSMAVLTPPVLAGLAAQSIGVTSERVGIFTAFIYAGAIVSSAGSGTLLARTGPLRLSQGCLVACAFGLAAGASGSLALVVIGAFAMGLGYGPVTPASSHILIRQTPPHRRAFVFSLKQTGVPVGGVLAGSVAAPLGLALGWQGSALAVAAACVVLALAVEPLRPRFDRREEHSAPAATGMLAGIRLVLGMPALRRLAFASTSFSATQLSFATFLVTFLTERAGLSLVTAGAVMAVALGGGIVGRIVLGWIADRLLPPRRLLGVLGVGMAVAAVATGLIDAGWPLVAVFAVTAVLGATGVSWNGVYLAEVAALSPAGMAGAATGGALSITFLGIVLGPALFSAIVSFSGSYAIAFGTVACCAFAGGIVAWRT